MSSTWRPLVIADGFQVRGVGSDDLVTIMSDKHDWGIDEMRTGRPPRAHPLTCRGSRQADGPRFLPEPEIDRPGAVTGAGVWDGLPRLSLWDGVLDQRAVSVAI
jgi:hypothetical protein